MNKAVEILLQKRLMILERGASVEDLQELYLHYTRRVPRV